MSDGLTLDLREQIARIDRAREEAEKFSAEQRKLSSEATKLQAEVLKFQAEQLKLAAEAAKLERDRKLAPFGLMQAIIGGLIVALANGIFTHWLR